MPCSIHPGKCRIYGASAPVILVGYAQNKLQRGATAVGAQFGQIGADAYDLINIQVTGYAAEDGTEADVQVQKLDAYGRGGMTYSYYNLPADGIVGWFDGYDEPVGAGTVTLALGEGFWISAPSAEFGIQTAGAVITSDIEVILRRGNTLVVNTTPVAIDLNDILVKGYAAETGTEADVQVQKLDAYGHGGMTYSYYNLPADDIVGWFDGYDEEVATGTVMIEPGEGVWVSAPSEAFSVVLPAPEL